MTFITISRDLLFDWAAKAGRVLAVLALAWLFARIARRLLGQLRTYVVAVIDRRGNGPPVGTEKRAATVVTALQKLIVASIWLLAVVMALSELNFHIEPVLAGLGIAGLSLGLGAQTLIRDWLGGLFLLFEDQIRIGDSVTINGVSGDVVELNLRTTVLRAESGALHVIPNGSITSLSNMTRDYSYYIFETILAHGADALKALEILQQTGSELAAEEPFKDVILGPLEIMGVDRLGERGATLRARIKTLPSKQYLVGRELNLRVKERFDGAGIAFPPPPQFPPRG